MKIACIGYRTWALNIYKNLKSKFDYKFLIQSSCKEFNINKIIRFNPDIILFYGWSWKVDKKLIDKYPCIMLHPSKLPKYRGGSPIQNQIIRNKKSTYISLFKMTNKTDDGDIFLQEKISLKGEIKDIFLRIEKVGTELTKKLISKKIIPKPQDDNKATIYKRLKHRDSEITLKELKNREGSYLYNKIRMLGDPYPNAYIKTKDGKKLIIKKIELKK